MKTDAVSAGRRPLAGTTEPVLVVGAGPAGLAVAAELGRLGVRAEILERGHAIGTAWRGRYDRLRLNTCQRNSALPGQAFPQGTPLYPSRDHLVRYLESYAERQHLTVRFGVRADRLDRTADGWCLSTSAGPRTASQVVFTVGSLHTPQFPDWPAAGRFPGRLLHSADYSNAGNFRGADVLVVGSGCSGMDIAYDLAEGGAARVRMAVRGRPNMLLRRLGMVPGDRLTSALFRLPVRVGDMAARGLRRMTVGDLAPWGLTPPAIGVFTDLRAGKVPTIVDRPVISAIRAGRIEIVASVSSVGADGVRLADGTVLHPDVIIAATGYGSGLEPIVGHLGVLDAHGMPSVHGGPASAPGLRFLGYVPVISVMGNQARDAARLVSEELSVNAGSLR